MTIKYSDYALKTIFNNGMPNGLTNFMKMHLYTAIAQTLNSQTPLSAFTEATADTWYALVQVGPFPTANPALDYYGTTFAPCVWTPFGATYSQTLLGYYLIDNNNNYLGAEAFPSPLVVQAGSAPFQVTLSVAEINQ